MAISTHVPSPTAVRLALASVVGVALYVVLDGIAQLMPPHYNPISQAESDLAVGPYGFVMTINFVVRGVLSLAFVVALARSVGDVKCFRRGLVLLGMWGVGALLLAMFPTDLLGQQRTLHGTLHLVIALIAFASAALGVTVLARQWGNVAAWRARQPALLSLALAADGVLLLNVLAVRLITRLNLFGLTERLFLGLILLWIVVAALGIWSTRAA